MDEFEKFYNRMLRFLSFRPRSEKEIKDKLKLGIKNKDSRIKESLIDLVIGKLKEKKFIDDLEFTKWWISSRSSFKPRSLRMLIIELKQKGIEPETINKLIKEGTSDLEMAKKLIEKKIYLYRSKPFDEIKIKLQRLLLSKGFSFDIIKEVLEDFKTKFKV